LINLAEENSKTKKNKPAEESKKTRLKSEHHRLEHFLLFIPNKITD
jgi:hypothetical protein